MNRAEETVGEGIAQVHSLPELVGQRTRADLSRRSGDLRLVFSALEQNQPLLRVHCIVSVVVETTHPLIQPLRGQ